jgi:hypothetical protein
VRFLVAFLISSNFWKQVSHSKLLTCVDIHTHYCDLGFINKVVGVFEDKDPTDYNQYAKGKRKRDTPETSWKVLVSWERAEVPNINSNVGEVFRGLLGTETEEPNRRVPAPSVFVCRYG